MQTKQYELVVSSGKRPLWKIILAALLFTLVLYFAYQLVMVCAVADFDSVNPRRISGILEEIGLCLAAGFYLSIGKTVFIDVDKDQLVSRFSIGPFSKNYHTAIPQLEYVAVFKNAKEVFEVNLWYKGNKHYKMFGFDQKAPAIDFAQKVCAKLKLDLLDATEKGNAKWTDYVPSEHQA